MALNPVALRSELGKAFDKNAPGFVGPATSNADSKAKTAQGWANALEACCELITPPSLSLAVAKAAFIEAMEGAFSDPTGAAMLAAFQTFASQLASGMSPTYVGTPPASPPVLSAPVPDLSAALDTHTAAIMTWLQTGTATPSIGGSPVNWA